MATPEVTLQNIQLTLLGENGEEVLLTDKREEFVLEAATMGPQGPPGHSEGAATKVELESEASTRAHDDEEIEGTLGALAGVMATKGEVVTERTNREVADGGLSTSIATEKSRAETAEGLKSSKTETTSAVTAEETRAKAAETALTSNSATKTEVSTEKTRAETAENLKATKTEVSTEKSRAETAEALKASKTELSTETSARESADATLTTNVSAKASKTEVTTEKERAETAEGLKATKTELTTEKTRAEGVEATKATSVALNTETTEREAKDKAEKEAREAADALKADTSTAATKTEVSTEKSRAETAEATKATTTEVSAKASKTELATEKTERETADGTKASKTELGTETTNRESAVSTEKSRAETAEGTKASKTEVTTEKERAETAEGTKATKTEVSTEKTRAEAAEATKATPAEVSTEKTRAEGAEATLTTNVALKSTIAELQAKSWGWTASDNGLVIANFDPQNIAGSCLYTTKREVISRVRVPEKVATMSKMWCVVDTLGAVLTEGGNLLGVRNAEGKLIAVTEAAATKTAFESTGIKSLTVSAFEGASLEVAAGSIIFLCVLTTGTTPVRLAGASGYSTVANFISAGPNQAAANARLRISSEDTTGFKTAIPATTTPSANNRSAWIGIS